MEIETMLIWTRRMVALVPAVVLLCSGCASDERCSEGAYSSETSSGRSESRLEALRASVAPVALRDVWGSEFLSRLVVERAWCRDSELLVEAFDSGSRNYELHSIDTATGVPRWVLVLGPNRLKEAPLPGDRLVALMTENDGGLTVVERRNGARVAAIRAKMGVATMQPAASTDTSVFVSSLGTNRVASIDPSDARVGWAFSAPGTITRGPVMTPRLPRRLAVSACMDGTVFAVHANGFSDGPPEASAWTYRLLGAVSGDLAVASETTGGKLQVSILVPCEDRGLYCLDAATGLPRWVYRTESAFKGRPTVLNGVVFARNADRLVAVKLADGTAAWPCSDMGGPPKQAWEKATEALAYDGVRAFLRAEDGRVLRCDAKSGQVVADARLSEFDMVVGGADAGVVVCLTTDGRIVAFK
jgi:hypothetical protein